MLLTCGASGAVAQIDPRAALLERAGWDALAGGHVRVAAQAFHDALGSDALNPRLHLGAGTVAYVEGRNDDARAELERALSLAPGLVEARTLLGRVHYRYGDLPAAIATLERAVADAPATSESRAMLERWRREAALRDRMRQVVGTLFTVWFDDPSAEALAVDALASLDRAYWRVGARLGAFPNQPIPVVVDATDAFADLTQLPAWAIGAFDGAIHVRMVRALEDPLELDRVLAHEFAHALVRTIAPRGVPAWLNEGLATALEGDDLGWAERVVRDAPTRVPLQGLTAGFSGLNDGEARLAYATSALAARRLLDAEGGAGVANLLRDLGEGADFDAAFLRRMHSSIVAFQAGDSLF